MVREMCLQWNYSRNDNNENEINHDQMHPHSASSFTSLKTGKLPSSAVKRLKCVNRHDSSDSYLNVSAVTSIDSSSTIFPNASNVHDGDIDSDIDDDIVDMTPQICRTSTMSIDNMDEDPDERDTRDEDIVKQTVHDNSNSSLIDTSISDHCVISPFTRDYIRSHSVKYEQTWHHSEEEKNDGYEYDNEYQNSNYIHYLHQED
eukprot:CAMPEP_0184871494 /NCGR_PEP_ID=MMETSP0580-20130426/40750_1 /TAXON_ID=1118495 /ORGANISM="Dactyliosolen fragilissimus" /LENGTH=202 /DNA_ID=CAMNT_0027374159 /DNA_START=1682 /DNA_END=2290 /DNA_ORIENTATION=-